MNTSLLFHTEGCVLPVTDGIFDMDKVISGNKPLRGEITVPGDKSISHRAVMIGSLARGETTIEGFLEAADPLSTLHCIEALGIETRRSGNVYTILGKGIHGYQSPKRLLDAGNSGTTMRLLSGILVGQNFESELTGDEYLRRRPMKRIIEPLRCMGGNISGTEKFTAPLKISPSKHLQSINYEMPIPSAQVKSAVLLAGLFAEGETRVTELQQSRDHTERMLGLLSNFEGGKKVITVSGGKEIEARNFVVPGDPSSAAFFVVAALLNPHSDIVIKNVGINPTRIGFLHILQEMGGKIGIENAREVAGEPIGDIHVQSSPLTISRTIAGDIIPNVIDEIPILSVAAAFANGTFEVKDAAELRHKECDRLSAICGNLSSMGIDVDEREDGFAFEAKNFLLSSRFRSFNDHRIAMAFGIAGNAIKGTSIIENAECVDISYPSFWTTLQSLTN
jgi:3-phosphoshikimate 1-carboxyvinyltransferase